MNERSSRCSCIISCLNSSSSGTNSRPDASERFIASRRKAAPARNCTTLSWRSRASVSLARASALSSAAASNRVTLEMNRDVGGDLFAKVDVVDRQAGDALEEQLALAAVRANRDGQALARQGPGRPVRR